MIQSKSTLIYLIINREHICNLPHFRFYLNANEMKANPALVKEFIMVDFDKTSINEPITYVLYILLSVCIVQTKYAWWYAWSISIIRHFRHFSSLKHSAIKLKDSICCCFSRPIFIYLLSFDRRSDDLIQLFAISTTLQI